MGSRGNRSGGDLVISRRERILLHLNEFPAADPELNASQDQTQEWIARALNKTVSNISRALKRLQADGLVEASTRRIAGG